MPKRLSTEEARSRALTTAIEIAAHSGIGGLTIDAISDRSGVAKTTIYRKWPSIDELKIDVVSSYISELATPDTGDLETDIRAIYEQLLDGVDGSDLRPMILSVLAAESQSPRLEDLRREIMNSTGNPVRSVLERAVERRRLPDTLDFDLAKDFVMGPVYIRRILDGAAIDRSQLAQLAAAVVDGLPLLLRTDRPASVPPTREEQSKPE